MKLLQLTEPVTINGPNLLGRKSAITFCPTSCQGWLWENNGNSRSIQITPELVSGKTRRISLNQNGSRLEIFEHIGPMVWTGLTRLIVKANGFTPYFGRVSELWDAIKPHCVATPLEVKWRTTDRVVKLEDEQKDRFVEFRPFLAGTPTLRVTVSIDYAGLGKAEKDYTISLSDLEAGFSAHTLGWPKNLYWLSRLAPPLVWKHHDHINWPQDFNRETILTKVLDHRFIDLLGTLSLLCGEHLIAGEVISHCAGHQLDVKLVKQLAGNLHEIRL
ncbi:MAG: UDP-3-O-acyl-N-acetylglucosamine deacetylase [Candidatus Buchananbacteria bacterium]|nr:UDP-3-O-acyl-N-acetylglucosamine deacetylase [Candidatus Buchananbacteria bacterium]